MNDETQALLDAEEAVGKVLDKLDKLQQEAGNYAVAKKSLEAVHADLKSFLVSARQVAEETKDGVAVLKELSMPEVLSRIDKLSSGIDGAHRENAAKVQSISDRLVAIGQDNAQAVIAETRAALTKLRERSDQIMEDTGVGLNKAVAEAVVAVRQQLSSAHAELQSSSESAGRQLQQRVALGHSQTMEQLQAMEKRSESLLTSTLAEVGATQRRGLEEFSSQTAKTVDGVVEKTKVVIGEGVAAIESVLQRDGAARDKASEKVVSSIQSSIASEVSKLTQLEPALRKEIGELRRTMKTQFVIVIALLAAIGVLVGVALLRSGT